jgi:hypothetical protein
MRRAIIAVVMALAGCSSAGDTQVADQAVPRFHDLLDAGQFDAIYATGSEAFKSKNTPEEFRAVLDSIHRKLGATKSSKQLGWNVVRGTKGTVVTLTYATDFVEGSAEETFTYRLEGGEALLTGYHISSKALILK